MQCLPETAPLAWIDRSDAGKLSVTGPDAFEYLQGHLSADLRGIEPGGGSPTALLTPKGHVRALGRVLRFERGWLLHCERPALDGLFRGLWSGRVGWRVALNKLTLQQAFLTVTGEDAARRLGIEPAAGAWAAEHAHVATALDGVPVRAVRSWAGVDLIVRADHAEALRAALTAAGAPAGPLERADWDVLRIVHGRLAYGTDVTEERLPAELALGAPLVATEKGLYPGLQTVLRQQRSGTVHREVCRVLGTRLMAPGDELLAGAGGPVVGVVTTGVCFHGLGRLRTKRPAEEPLIHAPSGVTVEVEVLERGMPSL